MIKVAALYTALRRIERARPLCVDCSTRSGRSTSALAWPSFASFARRQPGALARAPGASNNLALRGATHPLIERCVANDLCLSARGLVLTGSNMAGKSTFLRSVGLNAILSQSLGVVYFDSYEAPILRVYSSMSIRDDLLVGPQPLPRRGRADLELTRAAARGPCLFLIDEMFAGTNPVERSAAAHAVARHLSESHIVLLATHDLDLVVSLITDNFFAAYFSETADGDDLRFDYQLRVGAAGRPNAISILRALGFPESISADAERFAADMTQ